MSKEEEARGLMDIESTNDDSPFSKPGTRTSRVQQIFNAIPLPDAILSQIWSIVLFLLPSFIATRLISTTIDESAPRPALRPTAYLDGLRGVAAWAVFNWHLAPMMDKGYGAEFSHPGPPAPFYQLPILRTAFHGEFAVALFFIISGFALSIAPVAAMQRSPRDAGAFMGKVAGNVFKRPMRLFLPAWVSMFLVLLVIRADAFKAVIDRKEEVEKYMLGWIWPEIEKWPPRHESFSAQTWDVLKWCFRMFVVYKDPSDMEIRHIPYNPVLWTVKLEFRSSFVLYLTHAATFFMRRPARTAITVSMILLGVSMGNFDFPLFWSGFLMAEYSSRTTAVRNGSAVHQITHAATWLIFLLGAFLGSYPAWDTANVPDYSWLVPLTPFDYAIPERFWVSVGAILVLLTIPRLPLLIRFYTSPPVRYLGKISFSFYLVHFWMNHVVGVPIFMSVWKITGMHNAIATVIGFTIAYSIHFFLVIWVSDIFWRIVDQPSLILAVKFQKRLFTEL